jgi:hypothetical protein
MSMADPLGGGAGGPGAPTINARNVNARPPGGDDGDPGAPTINARNINKAPKPSWGGGGPVSIQDLKGVL